MCPNLGVWTVHHICVGVIYARKDESKMPKLVGATMALVALAASILAGVGPIDCLVRALIAYFVGRFATQLWYVFFTIRVERGSPEPEAIPQEAAGLPSVAEPVEESEPEQEPAAA